MQKQKNHLFVLPKRTGGYNFIYLCEKLLKDIMLYKNIMTENDGITNTIILKKCTCCKSEKLIEHFKINVKGKYNKTCIRCSKRRKLKK